MPTDDLPDFVDAFPNVDEPPPPPETIDDTRAVRLLRRLRHVRAEAARVSELAASERWAVNVWESDRLSGLERADAWITAALEGYARMVHARTGRKSVPLPGGTLQLRAAPLSVEVYDPDAFRAWCEAEGRDDLLGPPPPPPPNKGAIKKALLLGPADPIAALDEEGRAGYLAVVLDGGEDVVDQDGGDPAPSAEVVPGLRLRRDPTGLTHSITKLGGPDGPAMAETEEA